MEVEILLASNRLAGITLLAMARIVPSCAPASPVSLAQIGGSHESEASCSVCPVEFGIVATEQVFQVTVGDSFRPSQRDDTRPCRQLQSWDHPPAIGASTRVQ